MVEQPSLVRKHQFRNAHLHNAIPVRSALRQLKEERPKVCILFEIRAPHNYDGYGFTPFAFCARETLRLATLRFLCTVMAGYAVTRVASGLRVAHLVYWRLLLLNKYGIIALLLVTDIYKGINGLASGASLCGDMCCFAT